MRRGDKQSRREPISKRLDPGGESVVLNYVLDSEGSGTARAEERGSAKAARRRVYRYFREGEKGSHQATGCPT